VENKQKNIKSHLFTCFTYFLTQIMLLNVKSASEQGLMMEQKAGKPSLPSWTPVLNLVSISGTISTIESLIKTKCRPSHLLF
jgi:hypothetical protein